VRAASARADRSAQPDARDAAREYIRRGWAVIDAPARAKAPRRQDWQHARLAADDVRPDGNVGLLLGEPSGGLVDVDLDTLEAIAAAPYLLPETAMRHGRPTKQSSHWWYVTRGDVRTTRYRDPDGSTLVELRSTGCQTIVPPSMHPSGELITWDSDGGPAHTDADSLQRAVARVAACAMVARRWPHGSRHDAALALAGTLCRGGIEQHDAVRLVEVVSRLAGDAEWRDRVRAATDTAKAISAGEPATGAPKLVELIADGPALVTKLREWLRLAAPTNDEPDIDCPRALTLAEFLAFDFPPRENIMDPVFPRQGLGLIHSWRGLGKTYFALSFGLASAAGAQFLRWRALRAWKVLFVDGEMRGIDMQTRLAALVKPIEPRPDPGAFRVISPDLQPHGIPDLGTDAGQRWLDAVIDERDLVILDNLSSLVRSSDNEEEPWLPMLAWLLRLRASGRSAVLVHHDGKNETQRGISRREDQMDTVFHLRKAHDPKRTDGARFLVDYGKHRGFYGKDAEPFEATLIESESGGLTWAMTPVEDAVTMQVAKLINDGCTVSDIVDELKIGRATVDRHKKKAADRGLLK
jgi:hypothetical protein